MIRLLLAATVVASVACQSKSRTADRQMPAATSWNAPEAVLLEGGADTGGDPHAGLDMAGDDPHAGLDMAGDDPHAGLDMAEGDPQFGDSLDMAGGDPHAGLDMAGGDPQLGDSLDVAGGDPHAGMGLDVAGGDPHAGNAPELPIDPSKFLRGVIDGTDKTRTKIGKGAILFVAVRPINSATGEIVSSPIAFDRIDVDKLPLVFEITGEHVMSARSSFDGAVVIEARIDGDGEARSSEPGDIVGSVRADIPSAGIKLVLDTELR